MPDYSDATKQVLALAFERLVSDPSFSADTLASLKRLADEGQFHDLEKLLTAIVGSEPPAERTTGDGH